MSVERNFMSRQLILCNFCGVKNRLGKGKGHAKCGKCGKVLFVDVVDVCDNSASSIFFTAVKRFWWLGAFVFLVFILSQSFPAQYGVVNLPPGTKAQLDPVPAQTPVTAAVVISPAIVPRPTCGLASWPSGASYVSGYPQRNTSGLSKVTVDNSQNGSDVFVKLWSLDGQHPHRVRWFFIPARGRFTVSNLTAGSYDVRYCDLKSGQLAGSEKFTLEETETYDGTGESTVFSNFTMTLYTVLNGNMQTHGLLDAEF
jgi:hypothetical protein